MSPFIDKKYFTLDISTYGHITFKFCFKFYWCVAIFGSLSTKIGGWENFFFPQNPLQVIVRFLKNGGEINKPDLLNRQGTHKKVTDLWFIFFLVFYAEFCLRWKSKNLLVVQGIHPRPPLRGWTTNNTVFFLCLSSLTRRQFSQKKSEFNKAISLLYSMPFFHIICSQKKVWGDI